MQFTGLSGLYGCPLKNKSRVTNDENRYEAKSPNSRSSSAALFQTAGHGRGPNFDVSWVSGSPPDTCAVATCVVKVLLNCSSYVSRNVHSILSRSNLQSRANRHPAFVGHVMLDMA